MREGDRAVVKPIHPQQGQFGILIRAVLDRPVVRQT
jgi:hypothetical protein